jgi:hypothetical protein
MEKSPPIPPNVIPPKKQPTTVRRQVKLTPAGKALAITTVLTTIGAAWLFPFWIYPRFLPPGVYPHFILALPIILCGVATAIVGTWLLKKLGISTTKKAR